MSFIQSGRLSHQLSFWLNEGEEPFFKDIEDGSEEEGQSQEDEQLVCQFPSIVLKDQLPS